MLLSVVESEISDSFGKLFSVIVSVKSAALLCSYENFSSPGLCAQEASSRHIAATQIKCFFKSDPPTKINKLLRHKLLSICPHVIFGYFRVIFKLMYDDREFTFEKLCYNSRFMKLLYCICQHGQWTVAFNVPNIYVIVFTEKRLFVL